MLSGPDWWTRLIIAFKRFAKRFPPAAPHEFFGFSYRSFPSFRVDLTGRLTVTCNVFKSDCQFCIIPCFCSCTDSKGKNKKKD